MTHISQTLLAIACLVIASASILGIFHPSFQDTLLQRLGLSFTASGSTIVLFQMGVDQAADRAVLLTVLGAAIYGAATALKVFTQWCKQPHCP